MSNHKLDCATCEGKGTDSYENHHPGSHCRTCNGDGVIPVKNEEVSLPGDVCNFCGLSRKWSEDNDYPCFAGEAHEYGDHAARQADE